MRRSRKRKLRRAKKRPTELVTGSTVGISLSLLMPTGMTTGAIEEIQSKGRSSEEGGIGAVVRCEEGGSVEVQDAVDEGVDVQKAVE